MPPIVCIVGLSGSGKTTLLEKLIPEMKRRGYRVAAIKHTSHDFDPDTEGKDSWRYARAGADAVALSSARRIAVFRNTDHDWDPGEIAGLLGEDFDIVLAEGFKRSKLPKIEVYRAGSGGLLSAPEELLAVVSDEPPGLDVRRYTPGDVRALADLIERRVMGRSR